jgi:hypothetical protein
LGVSYRSYRSVAGTTVDVALPDRRTVILAHGCFWHGCPRHYRVPKSKVAFWKKKIETNRARDRRQLAALRKAGWSVLVIWEHDLKRDPEGAVMRLVLGGSAARGGRLSTKLAVSNSQVSPRHPQPTGHRPTGLLRGAAERMSVDPHIGQAAGRRKRSGGVVAI